MYQTVNTVPQLFYVFFLPLPQDKTLHLCQLEGRGLHMQWCSRVALPVRRCTQVTRRDWNPWRPHVAVHCVHGPIRHCRAQASVEQFFTELGLWRTNTKHLWSTVLTILHTGTYSSLLLPLKSIAHPGGDFGPVCVLAVNVTMLCGQTWTDTLAMALEKKFHYTTAMECNMHLLRDTYQAPWSSSPSNTKQQVA